MKTSKACLDLIKEFEGLSLVPYLDVAGIPTIGYGTTRYNTGNTVTLKDPPITQEQAENELMKHLESVSKQMSKYVTTDLKQPQIDALISLTYNIGIGNFSKSTLLKLLNAGEIDKASKQILVWNKSRGVVIKGLCRRRAAEQELFLS